MRTYRRWAQSRAAELAAQPLSIDRLTRAIVRTHWLIKGIGHIAATLLGARLLDTRHCERGLTRCIAVMRH